MKIEERGRIYFDNQVSETGDIQPESTTLLSTTGRYLKSLTNTFVQNCSQAVTLVLTKQDEVTRNISQNITTTINIVKETIRNISQGTTIESSILRDITKQLSQVVSLTINYTIGKFIYLTQDVSVTASKYRASLIRTITTNVNVVATIERTITRIIDVISISINSSSSKLIQVTKSASVLISQTITKEIIRNITQQIGVSVLFYYGKLLEISQGIYVSASIGSRELVRTVAETITTTITKNTQITKILDAVSITITELFVRGQNIVLSVSISVTPTWNYVRSVLFTARHTVVSGLKKVSAERIKKSLTVQNLKKAADVYLGGDEV